MVAVTMDTKTIAQLLAARKAIEACRMEKSDYRATLEKSDYSQMQSSMSASVINRDAELKKLGFDSLEDFSIFNDQMIDAMIMEYRPILGGCDKCDGYEGTPPCLIRSGATSCFQISTQGTLYTAKEQQYHEHLQRYKNYGIYERENLGRDIPFDAAKINRTYCSLDSKTMQGRAFCPPKHGFYVDCSKKLPFNPGWKI